MLMKHGTRIPHVVVMVTLSATEMIFPGGGAWVAIAFKLHVLHLEDTEESQLTVSAFFSLKQWFSTLVAH